jgi:glycerol-3-phosphate acyltransferase PlsX
VLLDVGANPAAKAEHLAQYAVMGAIYAREVLGTRDPSVGLMNIGSEDGKGNELVRDTHALLTKFPVRSRYIGNVEGRGLYQGEADVLVCEGFVGNVVLKVSEGMAEMMLRRLAHEVTEHLQAEKHLATSAFHSIARRYSYHESGGAPLLGVDGICMICHGSSNGRSIHNALKRAVEFQDRRINPQIVAELSEVPAAV